MSKVAYNKPALTYKDQLTQLQSRGLIIENEAKAIHLLEVISYYRLSGYWYPLLADKNNHAFKNNSTFETAFSLYKFDRELRLFLVRELEKIEVAIRAKMTYVLAHNRGSFWYLDSNNFRNHYKHSETIDKIKREFFRSDEEFIQAYKQKYSDPLAPSWMIFEVSSFGIISNLYSNFKPGKDKRTVAHFFGLDDKTFSSWMHSIVYLRNVCAHHSRLWNRVMSIQPLAPRNTKNQWLQNKSVSNNKTYFVLSMVIYLMNTINPNHSILERFNQMLENYPNVDTRAMGFPNNWQNEILWKSHK